MLPDFKWGEMQTKNKWARTLLHESLGFRQRTEVWSDTGPLRRWGTVWSLEGSVREAWAGQGAGAG